MTAQLSDVRVLFAGALEESGDANDSGKVNRIPLMMTTDRGNTWSVRSPYELQMLDPQRLMQNFEMGSEGVKMGYLVTGKPGSAFPEGIDVEVEVEDPNDPNSTITKTEHITGLTEAEEECSVAVYSDVDFISDMLAYQRSLFGMSVVGDNSALLMNTVEQLGGSTALISIRSRGKYKRPFTVVEEIEKEAEAETAEEEAKINEQIARFQEELAQLRSQAQKGEEAVVGSQVVEKIRDLEYKVRQAERKKVEIKRERRERIESLGNMLRNVNMMAAPVVILVIAIILGIWRSVRRRHYISHASDA
jgi:hypothetical protein